MDRCGRFAADDPQSDRLLETRAAFEAAAGHTLTAQLAYEAERQRELLDRPEFSEGVQAFLDKRAPNFAPR